jgi:hypothetical protein
MDGVRTVLVCCGHICVCIFRTRFIVVCVVVSPLVRSGYHNITVYETEQPKFISSTPKLTLLTAKRSAQMDQKYFVTNQTRCIT